MKGRERGPFGGRAPTNTMHEHEHVIRRDVMRATLWVAALLAAGYLVREGAWFLTWGGSSALAWFASVVGSAAFAGAVFRGK